VGQKSLSYGPRCLHGCQAAEVRSLYPRPCCSLLDYAGTLVCILTKLNGGLSGLHSADDDADLWLTSYS